MKASFKTNLTGTAISPTGIEVPPKVIATLGSTKKPSVVVTINGTFTYRTTVGVMGGKFMIPVSAERRKEAKIKVGDPIEVTLEVDTAERTVEVPADLAIALGKNKKINLGREVREAGAIRRRSFPRSAGLQRQCPSRPGASRAVVL